MGGWDIAKIFLILGVMLGVMYLLLFLVKKYLYTSESKNNGRLKINVLSTQTIIPKKFISVVEVKDKLYILGIGDNSVTLIDKIDADLNEEESLDINDEKPNFLKLLKKNMGIK